MHNNSRAHLLLHRRRFVESTVGLLVLGGVSPYLLATPESQAAAIKKEFGDKKIRQGRVALDIPALAENGNSVRMSINVDSPMTEQDFVESVHVFSEANPIPTMASYFFSPLSGRAKIQTRVRLNDTQDITAIARMSDGSLWADSTHVLVTIAACANPWL